MAYKIDQDVTPRITAAWLLAADYLADRQWHRTADVEAYLRLHTDLAPATIRNLLVQQSRRKWSNRPGRKPALRRGNARGSANTREIRLQ